MILFNKARHLHLSFSQQVVIFAFPGRKGGLFQSRSSGQRFGCRSETREPASFNLLSQTRCKKACYWRSARRWQRTFFVIVPPWQFQQGAEQGEQWWWKQGTCDITSNMDGEEHSGSCDLRPHDSSILRLSGLIRIQRRQGRWITMARCSPVPSFCICFTYPRGFLITQGSTKSKGGKVRELVWSLFLPSIFLTQQERRFSSAGLISVQKWKGVCQCTQYWLTRIFLPQTIYCSQTLLFLTGIIQIVQIKGADRQRLSPLNTLQSIRRTLTLSLPRANCVHEKAKVIQVNGDDKLQRGMSLVVFKPIWKQSSDSLSLSQKSLFFSFQSCKQKGGKGGKGSSISSKGVSISGLVPTLTVHFGFSLECFSLHHKKGGKGGKGSSMSSKGVSISGLMPTLSVHWDSHLYVSLAWHRRVVREEKAQAWAARGWVSGVVLFQLWLFILDSHLNVSLCITKEGGKGGKGSSMSSKGVSISGLIPTLTFHWDSHLYVYLCMTQKGGKGGKGSSMSSKGVSISGLIPTLTVLLALL